MEAESLDPMRRPFLRFLALLLLLVQAGTTLVRGQSFCIGLGEGEVAPHAHASIGSVHVHAHGPASAGSWHGADACAEHDPSDEAHASCGLHLHVEVPGVEVDGRGGVLLGPCVASPSRGPIEGLLGESLRGRGGRSLAGDLAWSCSDARRGLAATCLRL